MSKVLEKKILDIISEKFFYSEEILSRDSAIYLKLENYIDTMVKHKVSKEYLAQIFCQECSFRNINYRKPNYRKKDILNAGKYYILKTISQNSIENLEDYITRDVKKQKKFYKIGKSFMHSFKALKIREDSWYFMGLNYKDNYFSSSDFEDKLKIIPFAKYGFSKNNIYQIGEYYLQSFWNRESDYQAEELYTKGEEEYQFSIVENKYWMEESDISDREEIIQEIEAECGIDNKEWKSPNRKFDFFSGEVENFFGVNFLRALKDLYKIDKGRFYYIWTISERFASHRNIKLPFEEFYVSHKIHKDNISNAIGKKRFSDLKINSLCDWHGWVELEDILNNNNEGTLTEEERYRLLGDMAFRTSESPTNNLYKTHIYQKRPFLYQDIIEQPKTLFVELDLARPEEHILEYVQMLIKERKRNPHLFQTINEMLDPKKTENQDMEDILFVSAPKTLGEKFADMFFLYDYTRIGFSNENALYEINKKYPISINTIKKYLEHLHEYIDNKKYLKYYYSESLKEKTIGIYLEPKTEEDNYYDNILSEPYF